MPPEGLMTTAMHIVMVGIVVMMIISPSYVFTVFERFLQDNPEYNTTFDLSTSFVSPTNMTPMIDDSVSMDRDNTTLANIQSAIDNAPNSTMRRIWTVKQAEFSREMKWKMMQRAVGATARVSKTL
jgi:hypothetical protein